MFSTAFATIKFLSLTKPCIGFSSRFGTGGFLNSSSRFFLSTKFKLVSNSKKADFTILMIDKLTFSFVNQNWITGAFLSKRSSVRLQGSFRSAKSGVGCLVRMSAAFEVELASQV